MFYQMPEYAERLPKVPKVMLSPEDTDIWPIVIFEELEFVNIRKEWPLYPEPLNEPPPE